MKWKGASGQYPDVYSGCGIGVMVAAAIWFAVIVAYVTWRVVR